MFGWVLFLSQLLTSLLYLLNSLFLSCLSTIKDEGKPISNILRFRSGTQLKGPSLRGLARFSFHIWIVPHHEQHAPGWHPSSAVTPYSLQAIPFGLPSSEEYTHWCLVNLRRADSRKTGVFCRPRKELCRH